MLYDLVSTMLCKMRGSIEFAASSLSELSSAKSLPSRPTKGQERRFGCFAFGALHHFALQDLPQDPTLDWCGWGSSKNKRFHILLTELRHFTAFLLRARFDPTDCSPIGLPREVKTKEGSDCLALDWLLCHNVAG